jgi:hypothetical protein
LYRPPVPAGHRPVSRSWNWPEIIHLSSRLAVISDRNQASAPLRGGLWRCFMDQLGGGLAPLAAGPGSGWPRGCRMPWRSLPQRCEPRREIHAGCIAGTHAHVCRFASRPTVSGSSAKVLGGSPLSCITGSARWFNLVARFRCWPSRSTETRVCMGCCSLNSSVAQAIEGSQGALARSAVEELLRAGHALAKPLLERLVPASGLDVLRDGRPDHLGNRLIVHGGAGECCLIG